LVFADRANHRVVAIEADGMHFTSFGALGSGVGELRFPSGIAIGPADRIYVADTGNSRIVAVDSMSAEGWQSYGTKGGPTANDPLAVGRFAQPIAVAADATGIVVADPGAARVVRLRTLDDNGWDATAPGMLRGPAALALLPNGAIVVADLVARQLAFLSTPSHGVTETLADSLLLGPTSVVAVSDDRLIVCVAPLSALIVVDRSTGVWTTNAERSLDKLGLRRPTSMCLLQ
jgi:DNA-binding beta-propeller fold protein YncE